MRVGHSPPGVDVCQADRTRAGVHVLLGLLRLWHLNGWLELQRTAYIWPLPTFLLTLNKRRLWPCPLHLYGIAILQADQELCRSAQLHDVILPSSNRDAPLLRIHVLDGPR